MVYGKTLLTQSGYKILRKSLRVFNEQNSHKAIIGLSPRMTGIS
jgi:hypothetical protein